MRLLVVGSGGREHALTWALAKNPDVERIYAAPGNPGIDELASCVAISAADIRGLADFAERESVDLTVVGPEAPLVAGLADELASRGLPVFGPGREAARVEGSKAYARELCERHGIPGPRAASFDDAAAAKAHLAETDPPYVVKADGLAGGKGVVIAETRAEAERAVEGCLLERVFGDAGDRVVIEEYLEGEEVSALALTDGDTVLPLVPARDHKRVFEGDRGPNTGGMGAYSPVPTLDEAGWEEIVRTILGPAVAALRAEGVLYRGVLYAGLMRTADGPRLLEFNSRFGDPEAQAILPRLGSDLADALLSTAQGVLSTYELGWDPRACVTVVLAADGYPGNPRTGMEITGVDAAGASEDVTVFHAGTAQRDGKLLVAGGRVLAVSALGADLDEARERAYDGCARIRFDGMHYRRDIGDALGARTGRAGG